MKLEQTIVKLEKEGKKLLKQLEKPFAEVVGFVKKHKKLVIAAGVLFLLYSYLFAEQDEEQEEEDYGSGYDY